MTDMTDISVSPAEPRVCPIGEAMSATYRGVTVMMFPVKNATTGHTESWSVRSAFDQPEICTGYFTESALGLWARILDAKAEIARTLARKPGREITIQHAYGNVHATIVPNRSIRLHGTIPVARGVEAPFDVTYRVGEEAEYDSYNLHYIGVIVGIGPKSVSIRDAGDTKVHRVNIEKFTMHNDSPIERRKARNADWCD